MTALLFILFLVSLITGATLTVVQSIKASENKVVLKLKPFVLSLIPTLLFFSLYLGYYSVNPGDRGVVLRFGRPVETLNPGAHFVRPIGDDVVPVIVQRRIVKASEAASSSDLQIVNIETTLGYHVDPAFAEYNLVELNSHEQENVITPAMLEAMKAETAQYEVQGLIKSREQVRAGIENRIRTRLGAKHLILEDISITNFSFSQAYELSIEQKQVAEQNAEKSRNVLEQVKIEAQSAAAKAKGEADARIAQATGEAQSIILEAKAKAQAQELQRANITPELLQLRTIELLNQKWDGVLPSTFIGNGGVNPANLLIQPPAPTRKTAQKDDN